MPAAKTLTSPAGSELQQLARLYGVETSYDDSFKNRREAAPESLLRVLQILGAPVRKLDDAADALRERRQVCWRRGLEPVVLAWDGRAEGVPVRLPEREAGRLRCRLRLEGGEEKSWDVEAGRLSVAESADVEGVAYTARSLALPGPLPMGYHRLEVEAGGRTLEALVISAPLRSYAPPEGQPQRTWGVFLPLYALHSERSWGGGDFTDLRNLLAWVAGQGGGVAATLPLLAAFLDEPFECSPYSPVSRLFWNELYLDAEALPELAQSEPARAFLASAEFARERDALRALPRLDYRRQMALKRRVLAELARTFFREPAAERRAAFERFCRDQPQADDYARFRAVGERLRTPWPRWPAAPRDGTIRPDDFDEDARRYHLYVQWAAEEQLAALASEARRSGPGLYLDLPLGVDASGYDVWRERSAFAVGASGGAPPDAVFTKGQDWGFPPMHPEHIREQGYRYVLAYLRRQLAHAGVLRIDHVPVFHRLFWVPEGMEPSQGVYVRYPAEELHAVFSLESHRHRALLVGEDLGTVPPEVRQSMDRHNVQHMYVIQYELEGAPEAALPPVPAGSVASVNTHDMPPFAAFFEGQDILGRAELGLLGDQDPQREQQLRRESIAALVRQLRSAGRLGDADDPASVLRACLAHLAAGGARIVLANLEDLWLETRPQNVPTTGGEGNWRNKARLSFEEFSRRPEVADVLREIDRHIKDIQD